MRLFHRGAQWEILQVSRLPGYTLVRAKHLRTGRKVDLIAGPDYAPRKDALERALEMELENQLNPEFAEYRRKRLDTLPGLKL